MEKAVVGSISGKAMIIVAQFIRTNWFICGILIVICFASIAPSIGAKGGRKSQLFTFQKQLISSNVQSNKVTTLHLDHMLKSQNAL